MAIVERHCLICCKPEHEGHWPFCPIAKPEPEYRVVYGDNGTLRGTETWWHKDDPRAPFNKKRAAEEPEAFEIHNRFCGENGEPCQVCRLKAEREAK